MVERFCEHSHAVVVSVFLLPGKSRFDAVLYKKKTVYTKTRTHSQKSLRHCKPVTESHDV